MNTFEKILVLVVCCTVMVIVLVIGGNIFHKKYRIAEAIKSGVDPIEASIAINELTRIETIIYLAKKVEEK